MHDHHGRRDFCISLLAYTLFIYIQTWLHVSYNQATMLMAFLANVLYVSMIEFSEIAASEAMILCTAQTVVTPASAY